MARLLIVLSRQGGGVPEVGNPNGVLYNDPGNHPIDNERSIWVIGVMEEQTTWDQVFTGLTTQGKQVGVAIHCQPNAINDARIGEATALEGIDFLRGNYTTGATGHEQRKYDAHKKLADCVRNANPCNEAASHFDTFWNLCFKDPILEDLITLLRAHALAKSNGQEKANLAAVEAMAEFVSLRDEGKEKVRNAVNGATTYAAVRDALVAAVKAQDQIRR